MQKGCKSKFSFVYSESPDLGAYFIAQDDAWRENA